MNLSKICSVIDLDLAWTSPCRNASFSNAKQCSRFGKSKIRSASLSFAHYPAAIQTSLFPPGLLAHIDPEHNLRRTFTFTWQLGHYQLSRPWPPECERVWAIGICRTSNKRISTNHSIMSSNRLRRIAKEIDEATSDTFSKVNIYAATDDLTHLEGHFLGPPDTPYEGGQYYIDIRIPNDYPFRPPNMRFKTKIWHPNVSSQTVHLTVSMIKPKR